MVSDLNLSQSVVDLNLISIPIFLQYLMGFCLLLNSLQPWMCSWNKLSMAMEQKLRLAVEVVGIGFMLLASQSVSKGGGRHSFAANLLRSKSSINHWASFFGMTIGVLCETLFTYLRKIVFQEDKPLRIIADDETLVCRCECVTYHEIGQYLDQAWSTASGLKAETRVGMGICQGKQCGYALSQICSSLGVKAGDTFINIRIPLRPVPISALMQLPDKSDLARCS